jgi:homoserine kinase
MGSLYCEQKSRIFIMSVTVKVPATTANLGSGFDCIGAALGLYNQFTLTVANQFEIVAKGTEADRLDVTSHNLAYQAVVKVFKKIQRPVPTITLNITLGVPLARGLGSSATAIVGGLVGANALAGSPLNRAELMAMAIEMEGHPDNVVPALIGGCQLAASHNGGWEICDLPWHSAVVPVLAIPNFELSTATARQVLPTMYSRADAVFNISHLALLLRGLATGNESWIRAGLVDKIHQPYRQKLIKGYENVEQAALAAGAYGLVISGAGPTLLAMTEVSRSAAVVAAMDEAWQQLGIEPIIQVLSLDTIGAQIL